MAATKRAEQLIQKATKTNHGFDNTESKYGLLHPRECAPGIHLDTAMAAIYCGMEIADWDSVAEGYIMLQELSNRLGHGN